MFKKHTYSFGSGSCARNRKFPGSLFRKSILYLVLLSFLPPICYADKINFYISGGPTFTKLKNVNSVAINDFVVNNYITDPHTSWNELLGIGIAHTFEHVFNKPFDISLGITGYTINLGNVKGIEYPFANDGSFDTLNYKFAAQSNALMLESKLFYTHNKWKIFGLLGLGNAWNHLYDYNETPTDPSLSAASVPQVFSNNTNNAFAYEFGIGIQRQLFKDVKRNIRYAASIDYRYFNLGKGKLGSFSAQTTNERLRINNLYTQCILFSLNVSLS